MPAHCLLALPALPVLLDRVEEGRKCHGGAVPGSAKRQVEAKNPVLGGLSHHLMVAGRHRQAGTKGKKGEGWYFPFSFLFSTAKGDGTQVVGAGTNVSRVWQAILGMRRKRQAGSHKHSSCQARRQNAKSTGFFFFGFS